MLYDSPKTCINCLPARDSVFSFLNEEEQFIYSSSKECRFYKKGELIFSEGALPKGLYVLQKGKVKLTQTGNAGKEQVVHLAKDGDIMGYRAILGNDRYSCSAVAMSDSQVCFLSKAVFIDLVKKNGEFAFAIIQLLSNELRDAEKNITSFAQRPVKERVVQSILWLVKSYGLDEENNINIVVSREELSTLAGTTRETVIRVLTELQEERLIELSSKKIKILNKESLMRIANI